MSLKFNLKGLQLLSCLGLSSTGEVFNLEVEDVATLATTSLKAEKLILLGDAQGIYNKEGELISRISPSEAESAGLACLVVHPDYRSGKRGDRLLEHIEALAYSQGIEKVFVLTTQTSHWFAERGFVEVSAQALPYEKKMTYSYKRQSRVFLKEAG